MGAREDLLTAFPTGQIPVDSIATLIERFPSASVPQTIQRFLAERITQDKKDAKRRADAAHLRDAFVAFLQSRAPGAADTLAQLGFSAWLEPLATLESRGVVSYD